MGCCSPARVREWGNVRESRRRGSELRKGRRGMRSSATDARCGGFVRERRSERDREKDRAELLAPQPP